MQVKFLMAKIKIWKLMTKDLELLTVFEWDVIFVFPNYSSEYGNTVVLHSVKTAVCLFPHLVL